MDQIRLLLLASVIGLTFAATASEEQKDNYVKIAYYMMPTDKWTSDVQNATKNVLATEAKTYCSSNKPDCYLTDVSSFDLKYSDVGFYGTAEEEKNYLYVNIYISYPSGVTLKSGHPTTYVLQKSIVSAIIEKARSKLNDAAGYEITEINGVTFYKSPDWTMNKIMIPISCILLLVIIIIAIALHFWRSKKDKKEREMIHANKPGRSGSLEKSKPHLFKGKIEPSPESSPANHQHWRSTKNNMKNNDGEDISMKNYSPLKTTETDSLSKPNSKLDENQPLTQPEVIEEHKTEEKEKKKKHKHKKHKKDKKKDTSFENPVFSKPVHDDSQNILTEHEAKPTNITVEENGQNSGSDNENIRSTPAATVTPGAPLMHSYFVDEESPRVTEL